MSTASARLPHRLPGTLLRRLPGARRNASSAAAIAVTLLAVVWTSRMVTDGSWYIPATLIGTAFLTLFLTDKTIVVLLALASIFQSPIADFGPLEQMYLAEALVPPRLGVLLVRLVLNRESAAVRSRDARFITYTVAAYAFVVLCNFVRSRYFLEFPGPGVTRAFLGYFVALGIFALTYYFLVSGAVAMRTLARAILVIVLVISVLGLGAAALGASLDLGNLRYSVYVYEEGGFRIGFLEAAGTLGLALMTVASKGRYRWVLWLLFAAALVFSGGRGALVGTLVALVAYLLISRRVHQLVLLLMLAAMVGLAFPQLAETDQAQRLAEVNARELDRDGRTFLFEEALRRFPEHPVFGKGLGTVIPVYDSEPWLVAFYETQLSLGGHGTYSSLLLNFGLVGLLTFVGATLAAMWQLGRRVTRSPMAGFFFIGITAHLVSNVVGGHGADPLFFFLMAGGAAVVALDRGRGPAQAPEAQAA